MMPGPPSPASVLGGSRPTYVGRVAACPTQRRSGPARYTIAHPNFEGERHEQSRSDSADGHHLPGGGLSVARAEAVGGELDYVDFGDPEPEGRPGRVRRV